jgi:GPI mannosyltransferase 3
MIQQQIQVSHSILPQPQQTWWPKLHWVAVVSGLIRIVVVFISDRIHYADEIFQYLEQAHRLAFGYGMIPWEYRHGIRSWILPGLLAGLLNLCHRLHLDDPNFYIPAIKIFLCVLSISLIYTSYIVVRTIASESAARLTSVLVSFWYELIHFASRPTPEVLATYCLIGACALVVVPSRRRNSLGFGWLCGLSVILRLQYLPTIAVLVGWALLRWRKREVAIAASLILALVGLAGYIDYLTWGSFFASYHHNYIYNSVYKVGELFGTDPLTGYFKSLTVNSAGLFLIAVIVALRPAKISQTWFLLLCVASIVLPHSLISHKEHRFVFAAIPFLIMLTAIGMANFTESEPSIPAQPGRFPRRFGLYAVMSLIFGVSLTGMLVKVRLGNPVYRLPGTIMRREPTLSAYLWLHRQSDLVAILNTYAPWQSTGGYYYLHRNVPIYHAEHFANINPDRYSAYVSHIICPASAVTPGFVGIAKFGDLAVRRASQPPAQLLKLKIDTINLFLPGIDDVYQPRVQPHLK